MDTYFQLDGELFFRTKPEIKNDNNEDYTVCSIIYELVTSGGYLSLKYLDSNKKELYKEVTIQELDTQYVSISDFFKEANFVGQKVVRIQENKEIAPEKNTAMSAHRQALFDDYELNTEIESIANTYIMLYKGETHIILYEKSFYNQKKYDDIIVLDSRYVDDNWYYGAYEIDIKLEPTSITSYLYNNKVSTQHQKRY